MSTDFTIRPVGSPAAAPVAQPVSEAAQSAVATELPASQSVAAADTSVRVGTIHAVEGHPYPTRSFIDRAAASIVYQVVDSRTSHVVEAVSRGSRIAPARLFSCARPGKCGPTRLLATDRKA